MTTTPPEKTQALAGPKGNPTMLATAIIIVTALILGLLWHVGWQMQHDTKPRGPDHHR